MRTDIYPRILPVPYKEALYERAGAARPERSWREYVTGVQGDNQ